MNRVFVCFSLALAALLSLPLSAGVTNRILTVNQDGEVSSTNALATAAQLAAVAQSNELIRVQQEAAADGYNTATDLLAVAAGSITTTPVVYQSLEFTGFEAAISFPEDAQVFTTQIDVKDDTSTVDGTLMRKVSLDFAFTENLQTVKPYVQYAAQLEGAGPKADWNCLADELVTDPVLLEGTYTDAGGNVYRNRYSIDAWVPNAYTRGFFGVLIPNHAADATGATMDMPGVKNGLSGDILWGDATITFKGGYATAE